MADVNDEVGVASKLLARFREMNKVSRLNYEGKRDINAIQYLLELDVT